MLSRLALRNAQLLQVAAARTTQVACTTSGPPRPIRPVEPSPVRYGFIPEEWFTFFYPKTGVTGPYMFFASFSTYLLSKEIYVLEHEFVNGISVFIVWVYLVKKFGPTLAKYLDKEIDNLENSMESTKTNNIKECENAIAETKRAMWSSEGRMLLIEAKKEDIKVQLESAYRERINKVYQEVKRRLDYQLNVQTVERRLTHKHMVQWIVKQVQKAITPDLEKATLQQCIKDLEALAVKA